MSDPLERRARLVQPDTANLRPHDSSDSLDEDPTFFSPRMRPNVGSDPEQLRRRHEVEAALFGTSEVLAVGRFRLLNRLGAGGMGIVYAAYDESLDRKIAVKLLRPSGLDSAELEERTLREARALARLSHPNVVHVYEVGEFEDELFVAMEFLAGPTLRAWLEDDSERDWREVSHAFCQAGKGLAAAHAEGIVHRDFKPHNVMFGGDGRVRVLDFGLARSSEGERGPDMAQRPEGRVEEALTLSGMLLGTPAYMAPEQLLGQPADARSDQFGFCVALYEGLFGMRPFAGDTLPQLLSAVTRGQVLDAPPGSPVPTWLRKVVVRGLSRDPEQRFASMRALLDALADDPKVRRRKWWAGTLAAGLLAGASWGVVQSLPDEAQVCAGMDAKLVGVWDEERGAAVRAAIEGTGLGYAPDTWERVERGLDDYTQRWVAAREQACQASHRGEQSGELLDLRMACLDGRLQHVRATVEVLADADLSVVREAVNALGGLPRLERCADADALMAEQPPPEDPAVAERVEALDAELARAVALQETGKFAEALERVATVAVEAEALGHEPLMARAWLTLGFSQEKVGEYTVAEATLERAYESAVALRMVEVSARASTGLTLVVSARLERPQDARRWAQDARALARAAGTDQAWAAYLDALGATARSEGKYAEARGYYEEALTTVEGAPNPDPVKVANHLNAVGVVAFHEGKYEEAIDYIERTLAIKEGALGPTHPDVALALDNLGVMARRAGHYEIARNYIERSLAILEVALGPNHPDVATTISNLGGVATDEGKYEEARECFERALAIKRETLGSGHPKVVPTLNILASVARLEGKYEEARATLEQALVIGERALGPKHPTMAGIVENLGAVAAEQEKYEEACAYFERALAIREDALGPEHPELANSFSNLGTLRILQNDYETAQGLYERSLAILESALGPEDPKIAGPLTGLGKALYLQEKAVEALPHLERALSVGSSSDKGDPHNLRDTHFMLAQVLWDAPARSGRNRERAHELAELARVGYTNEPENLREVQAWLANHPNG